MKFVASKYVEWAVLFFKALVVAIVVWGFSFWRGLQIPRNISSIENMQKEPLQTTTTNKPFTTAYKEHTYQIEPVFNYEMWGLVVSDHNSDSWMDSDHEHWNDYINTKDICIIWGKNVLNPLLSKMNFRNGNWTCYFSTKDGEAWRTFKPDQLSNNHVIPANPEVQKLIANSRVGDEIRIKGQLVNYSVNKGSARKSSTVRNDRDNGACEIIYVEEFETFTKHNALWNKIERFSGILIWFLFSGVLFSILGAPLIFGYSQD